MQNAPTTVRRAVRSPPPTISGFGKTEKMDQVLESSTLEMETPHHHHPYNKRKSCGDAGRDIDLRVPRKRTSSIDERGTLMVTTSAGVYDVRDIPLPGEVVEQTVVEVVDPMQALEQGLISSEKVVDEKVFKVEVSAVPQWSGFFWNVFERIFASTYVCTYVLSNIYGSTY